MLPCLTGYMQMCLLRTLYKCPYRYCPRAMWASGEMSSERTSLLCVFVVTVEGAPFAA